MRRIDAVGLGERTGQPVSTLSGGQQQRVLMARALAGEPDLMLLDEPNAGVDVDSQHRIADTLAERAAAGATLLVVLHELGPFAPLIQRAVMLREGRLVYDGPPVRRGRPARPHPPPPHHDPDRTSCPDVRAPFEGGR